MHRRQVENDPLYHTSTPTSSESNDVAHKMIQVVSRTSVATWCLLLVAITSCVGVTDVCVRYSSSKVRPFVTFIPIAQSELSFTGCVESNSNEQVGPRYFQQSDPNTDPAIPVSALEESSYMQTNCYYGPNI